MDGKNDAPIFLLSHEYFNGQFELLTFKLFETHLKFESFQLILKHIGTSDFVYVAKTTGFLRTLNARDNLFECFCEGKVTLPW